MTTTTQPPNAVPDNVNTETGVAATRSWTWPAEVLYGTVAGAIGLAAFCLSLLAGMPKPISYTIVGVVCLWLVSVGADRLVKRRRASR